MKRASSSQAKIRGFTLFETVLATGVGVLAFAAVASMMLFGSKSTVAMGNYADLDIYNRKALDQMTSDIRQANNVVSCSSTRLRLQTVDINTGATNLLVYLYDPVGQTLTRFYGGATNTLLKGVVSTSLQFSMYLRNPLGGDVSTN